MRGVKNILILSLLLGSTAGANSLSQHLPAGALATLETQGFGATQARVMNVLAEALEALPEDSVQALVNAQEALQPVLDGSINNEATLGLFTVDRGAGPHHLGFLFVTRIKPGVLADVKEFFPVPRATARVGQYGLARQGKTFVGLTGDLMYLSSDKALLTGYLGRLSGKAAPRLGESAPYTAPARRAGNQELSVYLNFSAGAKVIRGFFGRKIGLPRLLSPVVDAVDTLGQWRGGFRSTAQGFSGTSVLAVNPTGKDRPLRTLLTHTRPEFQVQRVIPAGVSTVKVSACSAAGAQYTAHWLTRIDLLDVTGFLSDSQLAAGLEEQSRYLGDECAQITLAGLKPTGALRTSPLAGLNALVTYQRVADEAAARAHMPVFAASVNTALRGALKGLHDQLKQVGGTLADGSTAAALTPLLDMLDPRQLDQLSLQYGFRDGYLVTAFSKAALQQALNAEDTLADAPEFRAAELAQSGAGFSWSPAPQEPFTGEGLLESLDEMLQGNPVQGLFQDPELQETLEPVAAAAADVLNRYGGASSLTSVSGTTVVTQGQLKFDWE